MILANKMNSIYKYGPRCSAPDAYQCGSKLFISLWIHYFLCASSSYVSYFKVVHIVLKYACMCVCACRELQKYKRTIYYTPWSRVGTFAIGLLLGYELHLTGGNYKMKKVSYPEIKV